MRATTAPRIRASQRRRRALQLSRRLRRNLLEVSSLPFAGFLPLGQQQIALHGTQVIEKQNAVEVIDLVLDRARLVAVRLDAELAAVAVERLDHDPRRTLDI